MNIKNNINDNDKEKIKYIYNSIDCLHYHKYNYTLAKLYQNQINNNENIPMTIHIPNNNPCQERFKQILKLK